jgi:hypothetical protein
MKADRSHAALWPGHLRPYPISRAPLQQTHAIPTGTSGQA